MVLKYFFSSAYVVSNYFYTSTWKIYKLVKLMLNLKLDIYLYIVNDCAKINLQHI